MVKYISISKLIAFCGMEYIMEKVKAFFSKVGNFFKNVWSKVASFFKKVWGNVSGFCKNVWNKCVTFFKEKTKNVNWKEVWDKCTTGLLILIIISPLLILGWIFLWFVFRP